MFKTPIHFHIPLQLLNALIPRRTIGSVVAQKDSFLFCSVFAHMHVIHLCSFIITAPQKGRVAEKNENRSMSINWLSVYLTTSTINHTVHIILFNKTLCIYRWDIGEPFGRSFKDSHSSIKERTTALVSVFFRRFFLRFFVVLTRL